MTEIWKSRSTKLGENFAKELKITSLPVDPIEIAEELDIFVEPLPADKKGVSGMLVESNNNFGIKYATYVDNIGFQNFCVGHELGHYNLPGHYEQLMSNGYHESTAGFVSKERYELEADHFSAGLLMPSYLFNAELNKSQVGFKAIDVLSQKCKTSLTATAIRYAQKTPDPIAIIISEGQTIHYCFMSDEMKEIKGLTWIKKGSRLSQNTVTSRFNKIPQNISNSNQVEGEATLLDWFGSYLEYEVNEEVIGLGRYGKTLTVLTIDELPDQEDIDDENDLIESWTPRFKR
ncbi:MAG: ImmA/IrrE family metallo-endopeptidase [Gammaproteobacteria bacterium]|nr:ImmA/IrrE family metallo-endopeptidase [Gammaproteobacteria bacterium]